MRYVDVSWNNAFCKMFNACWTLNACSSCVDYLAKSYASLRLQLNPSKTEFIWFGLEMCMGMRFPMKPGIPWESHENGNKTQKWEWECEGMGNHLSGNGNYLQSHGNLFPKALCCDELSLS